MKKICLVYANCQNKLIANYLSQSSSFNQEYQIHRFPVHLLMEKGTTVPDAIIKQAKLFIYQPVKKAHGDRSSESILNKLPANCRRISFPSLYFKGYFPQYCKNPVNHILKPNYPYGFIPHGDSNVISLLAEGKSTAEITSILSDPDFYTQNFVQENLSQTLSELRQRESVLDVKISDFITTYCQKYYLFHTQNHPTDIIGIHIANQILQLLNLPTIGNPLSFSNPHRGILDNFQVPIYPSVIKHLNLNFVDRQSTYRHSSFSSNKINFSRYISEYIDLHLDQKDDAHQHYFSGLNSLKQNKLSQAASKIKQAIKIKPNNATYYGDLGDILQKQNKLDDAESAYKEAIALSPQWDKFYQSLGDILSQKNNFDGAILLYKKAISLNPLDSKSYRALGDILMKQEKLDLAEKLYQKALSIEPNNAFYYRRLADLFQRKNNLDLAVDNYQKAIAIAPKTAYFYSNLSRTLAQQNKLDEALNTCKRAIKLADKNPNYHRTLGDIQLQKGEVEQALNTYQQAIKLNPNQMNQIFPKLSVAMREKIS